MSTTLPTRAATDAALDELSHLLSGTLHRPGSDAYVTLGTPWNVSVASRPLAVAAVATAEDVQTAVRWGARHDVQIAVRATGHGAADELDDTLLVHTGLLDELSVSEQGWARAGAGVQWQRVIEQAAPFGLAPLAGSAPGVGVVGFLTGGGFGPIARTFGLSADSVRAIDVVTGDGELRHVTAEQEPSLFWGLRGGKGALGIVTAIEFDLVHLPTLLGGALYFDGADASHVLHTWAAWCPSLPASATTSIAILRLPPLPGVPAPLAGRTTVAVRFAWTGDPDVGEAALEPIRTAAPVVFGGVGVMPSAAMGMIHADPVDPMPSSERATLLRELPAEAVDALLAVVGPETDCPQVVVEIRQLGGRVAAAPQHASAFCWRDTAFTFLTIGIEAGPGIPATHANARAAADALAPWATGHQMPNFAPSTDPEHALEVYDRDTLARLGTLIAAYDPDAVISASRPIREACMLSRS